MSLFRREHRQWTPEPFVPPFPGAPNPFDTANGVAPTIDRAMQVSAVWACVRLLSDSVSMMPLHAYTMRQGIRQPTNDPALIVKPSADASIGEFVYMLMVSMLLRGNAYGQVLTRAADDSVTQVELLNPDRVQPFTGSDGNLTYLVNGVSTPASQLIHLRAFPMPGQVQGLSPIAYAARQINTEAAISEFAYGFFRDGAHPSAVLSTDQTMDGDKAKTIKDRFMAAVKGREPAVLTSGLKYESIQITPEESQFLKTQQYGVASIARIFGVPPEMIAAEAGNSMTYNNAADRRIDFLTYSVQPWMTRLESALSALLPGQRHVRFDPSVLTRTDVLTTMTASSIGIASKQLTPDEARGARDLAPLTQEQKDELAMVPLTVKPSGKPAAAPLPAPAPQPNQGVPA